MTGTTKKKHAKLTDAEPETPAMDPLVRSAKQLRKLAKGVRRFRPVRFIRPDAQPETNVRNKYIILGEVGSSGQYVLMSIVTGEILAGMVKLDALEKIPKDEL